MSEENSNKIQDILDILTKQDERLQRIENGLKGDGDMGSSGLVNRFQETEQLARSNKKSIEKILIISSTIAIVVSIIFQVIVFAVQYIPF